MLSSVSVRHSNEGDTIDCSFSLFSPLLTVALKMSEGIFYGISPLHSIRYQIQRERWSFAAFQPFNPRHLFELPVEHRSINGPIMAN